MVAWWLLGVVAEAQGHEPLPFWAAFAIGAVVAPPDAVAATAIAKRVGLPRRVVTILEGESLVNDATALVCLRTALAAAAGRRRPCWTSGWTSSARPVAVSRSA